MRYCNWPVVVSFILFAELDAFIFLIKTKNIKLTALYINTHITSRIYLSSDLTNLTDAILKDTETENIQSTGYLHGM